MLVIKTEWREEEHPRDERGRFTEKPDAPERAKVPEGGRGFFAGQELFVKEVNAAWDKRLGEMSQDQRDKVLEETEQLFSTLQETLEYLRQDIPTELVTTVARGVVLSLHDALGGIDYLQVSSDRPGQMVIAASHEYTSAEMRFTLLTTENIVNRHAPGALLTREVSVVSDAEFDAWVDQAVTEYAESAARRGAEPEVRRQDKAWVVDGNELHLVTPGGQFPDNVAQFLDNNEYSILLHVFDRWLESIHPTAWVENEFFTDDQGVRTLIRRTLASIMNVRRVYADNLADILVSYAGMRMDGALLARFKEMLFDPWRREIDAALARDVQPWLERLRQLVDDVEDSLKDLAEGRTTLMSPMARALLKHLVLRHKFSDSLLGWNEPRHLVDAVSTEYGMGREEAAQFLSRAWEFTRRVMRDPEEGDQLHWFAQEMANVVTLNDVRHPNERELLTKAFISSLRPNDYMNEIENFIDQHMRIVLHQEDESLPSREVRPTYEIAEDLYAMMRNVVPESMRDDIEGDRRLAREMEDNRDQLELYWDWAHVRPGGQGLGSRIMPAVLSSLRQLGIKHVFFDATSNDRLNGAVTWAGMGADWGTSDERARLVRDFIVQVLEARAATVEELRAVDWSKVRRPYDLLNLEVGGKKLGRWFLAAEFSGSRSVHWLGKVRV